MTYHLTLTSDLRTWPVSKKILFLGEWCLKYSQRDELKNLDFKVCEPILIKKNERQLAINEIFNLVKLFAKAIS